MKRVLIDKDPFSNGSEYMRFETYNCDQCIKSSEPKANGTKYTNSDKDNMPKCPIQRDIVTRMFTKKPIYKETVTICEEFILYGVLCPYMKTERKKYPKKSKKQDTNQTTLEIW